MNQVGQPERQTQNRIVQIFQQQLNYRYLGNWQDRLNNSNIETDILSTFLRDKQGYSNSLITKALYELNKVAGDQTKSLYDINKQVYSLLRYGVNVKEEVGENTQTVWLINWEEPLENDFAIAEEVTVKGENTKRPDIVLYVNGIAIGVLELKRSTVSVSEGIRQNLDNQKSIFIKSFFNTMQFVMAGNDTEGLRYATIETPEKYFLTWKEDTNNDIANPLDKHLLQLCTKKRFLELIHDFIVFDRGIKKVCRHNQYFGVNAAQSYLRRREGGIIWHTQGRTKDRLQSGHGNAMLVSGSIYQACKYYELFVSAGFSKCAIVTSYKPSPKDIKGKSTGEEELTEKLRQYEIYQKMLNGKPPEVFEDDVKKKFVEEPAQMKLLIVVDKLLTGFDAPSATYLYIDKTMRDHGLFQAICRVNRLDGEDKEYGYIIDYKDLFKSLEKSINDYTSEAFEDYEPDDIDGLLSDRIAKGRERLEDVRESIKALCEPVERPRDTHAYIRYFCGADSENPDIIKKNQQQRIALYKYTSALVRAYANLSNDMAEAGYSKAETEVIKQEVKHYEQVRAEVKLASGDYIDLKAYEPAMRHLIDTYIGAEDSEIISAFDDMTLIQLIVERGANAVDALPKGIKQNQKAVAETIENNLRKVIIDQQPTNPKYFDKMSTLLDELIQARKAASQDYKAYLQKIVALSKQVAQPSNSSQYPQSLNSAAKRALYDNLNQDEVLALAIDEQFAKPKKIVGEEA
ncbi:type I restriction endonuclease [Nostoc sp. UHCC 0870]|uniref:type I restriction endonuclease n=1 Tax=Nostoc sp. UHCC 0870 TaxID=2914041 RepID=UPI001EDD2F5A|nr:type I restriction endonuclease [Nostoc sp. UHCC 0870]UKO98340.1 type I restriction endonuclease [Nostoc sp. UHCC 0870]